MMPGSRTVIDLSAGTWTAYAGGVVPIDSSAFDRYQTIQSPAGVSDILLGHNFNFNIPEDASEVTFVGSLYARKQSGTSKTARFDTVLCYKNQVISQSTQQGLVPQLQTFEPPEILPLYYNYSFTSWSGFSLPTCNGIPITLPSAINHPSFGFGIRVYREEAANDRNMFIDVAGLDLTINFT